MLPHQTKLMLGTTVQARTIRIPVHNVGREPTPDELAEKFSVPLERIHQMEAKALRKLKHPSRSRKLRSFLDN